MLCQKKKKYLTDTKGSNKINAKDVVHDNMLPLSYSDNSKPSYKIVSKSHKNKTKFGQFHVVYNKKKQKKKRYY